MIEFDTSELDSFIKKLDGTVESIRKSEEKFLNKLNYDLALSATLQRKIFEMVYSDEEPSWYQRTGDLLRAVRCDIENNTLYLYIDSDFLKSQPQANEFGEFNQWGTGSRSHGGIDYSVLVHEGHTYFNMVYNDPINQTVEKKPRRFMKATFKELVNKVMNGKVDGSIIVKEIIKGWDR